MLRRILSIAVLAGASVPSGAGAADVWHTLALPGDRVGLCEAAGLDPDTDASLLLLDLIRKVHRAPEIVAAPLAGVRRYLLANQGAAGSLTLPLPLGPDAWAALLQRPLDARQLVLEILGSRRASLLYFGLAALDEETLRFLDAHRDLLTRIYEQHATAFAAFGRSLAIAEGEIVLPGGPDARHLWERLARAPATDPTRFIETLLSRDEGRLAYFFDTLAHLDAGRARFALTNAGAVYDVFKTADRRWEVLVRPLSRPTLDAAWVLQLVDVAADGRLKGPRWPRFWQLAFRGNELPNDPARDLGLPAPVSKPVASGFSRTSVRLKADTTSVSKPALDDEVDAAWLLRHVLGTRAIVRHERFTMLRFAQRVFPDARAPDAPNILLAVLGFARFPALMLTLERMDVRDPEAYARAARYADEITRKGSAATVAAFQAALAILERLRFSRRLSTESAASLVGSLVDIPLTDGEYSVRLARWLETVLAPALGPPPDVGPGFSRAAAPPPDVGPGFSRAAAARLKASTTNVKTGGPSRDRGPSDSVAIEAVVQDAMAGIGTNPAATTAIEWEGLRYRVDIARAERERLDRMRQRQAGVSLDAALARLHEDATDGDGSTHARAARRESVRAAERGLADALVTLVYAAHLGDPDGPVALAGDVARRHDFALEAVAETPRAAWEIPIELAGGGGTWHVRGALLGLDYALAELSMRRLVLEHPPRIPTLSLGDRRIVIRTAVLMSPFDLTDADRDRLVAAMRAGRAVLATLRDAPRDLEAAAATAGIGEWRRRAIRWAAARGADVEPLVSLAELAWLGGASGRHGLALDSWGAPAIALDGCLCLRFPDARPWEEFAWRAAIGQLAARSVDLQLRIAEALADLGLPAALVPAVLMRAALEYADALQPSDENDWFAGVRQARRLTRERIEDYVASLAAGGPLLADSSPP